MKHHSTVLKASLLSLTLAVHSPGAVMAPNAPSVAGDLLVWLEDATLNFDAVNDIWTDSSGNGNHAVRHVGINDGARPFPATSGPSTVGFQNITATGAIFNGQDLTGVAITQNGLMKASAINGGTPFTDLTILTVYSVPVINGSLRPVGIGAQTDTLVADGNYDFFNLGSDGSIRFDDGANIPGSTAHVADSNVLVLRAARLSDGGGANPDVVYSWVSLTGGPLTLSNLELNGLTVGSGSTFGTISPNFQTRNDDLYLGQIQGGVDASVFIHSVAVYGASLTDQQISDIGEYLTSDLNIGEFRVLPEPSTFGLLLMSALLMRRVVRRR